MLVALPFIAILLLTLTFQVSQQSWRRSLLDAAVVWGLLVTGFTEGLSPSHSLTAAGDAWLWGATAIFSSLLLWNRLRHGQRLRLAPPPLPFLSGLLIGVAVIIGTTGLVALTAPPNTWDSLTYHMSRVMHWIQNGTVAHYPTHIQRQLHHSPWTEFAILQFQLLSGSDRFANTVQWLTMVGSIVGASILAQQLGAGTRGQIFSTVIAATIPMGILQASSTQTDWAASLWLVCCTHYGLRLREHGLAGPVDRNALGLGASLGLAILTKPTAYVFAFPFLAWFLIHCLRTNRRFVWPAVFACIAVALSLNTGHYTRNAGLYGSPLGPMEADLPNGRYTNEDMTVSLLASNLTRNLSIHLQSPNDTINSIVEQNVRLFHDLIGVSIEDSRTTFSQSYFRVFPTLFDEDGDGNTLHLILALTTIILTLSCKPLRNIPGFVPYVAALTSAFVLFCLLLKWQPYNSRLHLPWFVLWSPLIGLALAWGLHHRLANGVMILMLLASLPWLLFNNHRPLVGRYSLFAVDRQSLYSVVQPGTAAQFKQVGDELRQRSCFKVGLMAGGNAPEYLLWVALPDDQRKFHIEHISVTNPSAVLFGKEPFRSFAACRTIVLDENPPGGS